MFAAKSGWDEPVEPLAIKCINIWGKLKANLTGKEQFVAGNHSSGTYNNYDNPTDCRVIANPKLFGDGYSLWVEQRVSVDGPGSYYDRVSFRSLGVMPSAQMKEIVAKFKKREEPTC